MHVSGHSDSKRAERETGEDGEAMKSHVGGGNETLLRDIPSWTNAHIMTSLLGDIGEYNTLSTIGYFTFC